MNTPFNIEPSWKKALEQELKKPYIQALATFIAEEREKGVTVYPSDDHVFAALSKTPYDKVKVVIIGQDPYHGPGQANGLSFSVEEGISLPPSLKNIFKELSHDLDVPLRKSGSLLSWAEQGVLLLNVTLTVAKSNPLSHHGKGWELFTDAILEALCQRKSPTVFMLWGKNAEKKCDQVKFHEEKHLVLKAAHPSPFSAHRGFFGCRHFSKANDFLINHQLTPIDFKN